VCSFDVPLQDLFEHSFPAGLDHVAVARDDLVEVPSGDSRHAFVEAGLVRGTSGVPDESLLRWGWSVGAI
jgi:hypothetical protein